MLLKSKDHSELLALTFASQLVNQFALPEEHRVLLVFDCFFLNHTS